MIINYLSASVLRLTTGEACTHLRY